MSCLGRPFILFQANINIISNKRTDKLCLHLEDELARVSIPSTSLTTYWLCGFPRPREGSMICLMTRSETARSLEACVKTEVSAKLILPTRSI